MKHASSLAAAILLTLASPAFAADGHTHAAKHGGKVVESGHHHLELVAKDGEIALFVRGEDDKPEDVSAAKATATILSGGKPSSVTLTSGADGALYGTGDFTTKGATVVVTLTMPEHKPEQARFKLD